MSFVAPPPQVDRGYISQFSNPTITLQTHVGGVVADVDGAVLATFSKEATDDPPIAGGSQSLTMVFSRNATHAGVGTYTVTISGLESQTPGLYRLVWTFTIATIAQTFVNYFEVGPTSPDYDGLSDGMKDITDRVWRRFADLFDSPDGGPNLMTYYQSNWSRGRVAGLLRDTIDRLNVIGQPRQSYTAYAPSEFPIGQWSGILSMGLYIECIKHLIRSYTEQPVIEGVSVARVDRRDYMNRWQSVLQMELEDYRTATDTWRISNMNLGKARVLVSGGAYGRYSPNRLPVSAAARPRYWFSFY